jgi:putative nucleotidyltransferase with HDIG domain
VTVPSRDEAARILLELDPPDWLLAHSAAVAEIAAFLAERLRKNNHDLPPDLAETAALLHDVDKTPSLKELRRSLGHGWAGAAWLTGRGYSELAAPVASHPATRLTDEAAFTRWLADATWSEKVVAYADKRATQDLVSIDERFATWQTRHPERADQIARGCALAATLEQQVCAAADLTPTDVERLAWVPIASRS